jgi:hypothetical protein
MVFKLDWERVKDEIENIIYSDYVSAFFTVLGIGFIYYLLTPQKVNVPPIKESILGDRWETNIWRQIKDIGEGYAIIENGIFKAMVDYPTHLGTMCSLIQQGKQPHGWWDSPAKLKKEITITLNDDQILIVELVGKRTTPITWYNLLLDRVNDIGMLLIGDVGLGYDDPDVTNPHALYIDFWFDIKPEIDQNHWEGVAGWENDYHSGYRIASMPNINQEYSFRLRIDNLIRDALRRWNLERFTIKTVQLYIEARNSKAEMEIYKFDLGMP